MNAVATKPILQKTTQKPERERKPRNHRWLLLLIAVSAILYFAKETKEPWEAVDFLEKGPDGKPQPAQEDLKKLQKELDELDSCEQYILLAKKAGMYECLRCEGMDSIYLYKGETWKIGKSCTGEKVRYSKGKKDPRLEYKVEFTGNSDECARQEKIKIYWYVSSPENIKRRPPLRRPPGNRIRR